MTDHKLWLTTHTCPQICVAYEPEKAITVEHVLPFLSTYALIMESGDRPNYICILPGFLNRVKYNEPLIIMRIQTIRFETHTITT